MAELKVYENGLRLCVEKMDTIKSVSVGIMVGVGSKYENAKNNGISHFIEHMTFKGTEKMSAMDIARKFDECGAISNAFTTKESTCFYFKCVDRYTEKCFDVLSDIFFNSVFDEEEIKREKNVVIDELNMGNDSGDDICFDLIASAAYGKRGLGATIIGTKKNIENFTQNDLKSYISKYYVSHNIVVTMAGNITMEEADALVVKYMLPHFKKAGKVKAFKCGALTFGVSNKKIKKFEQSNLGFAFEGVAATDDSYYDALLLSVILGGGMSSRLFQNIREKRGLAYNVGATIVSYCDAGLFVIYVNNAPKNSKEVVEAVREEINKAHDEGITEEELFNAKNQLLSSLVFSQEKPESIMISQNSWLIRNDRSAPYDVRERIKKIDACTVESVNAYSRRALVTEKANVSYVGKALDFDPLVLLKS